MSKQFRVYLLPSDIEDIFAVLRAKIGVKIIPEVSQTMEILELDTPLRDYSTEFTVENATSVRCYLAPPSNANLQFNYYPKQTRWQICDESEAIEFSGCDYDGSVLLIGRFYYQNDFLLKDTIWKKRSEFITWADRIFGTTKRLLKRSPAMNAYVGDNAAKWLKTGGRFASAVGPARKIYFEENI